MDIIDNISQNVILRSEILFENTRIILAQYMPNGGVDWKDSFTTGSQGASPLTRVPQINRCKTWKKVLSYLDIERALQEMVRSSVTVAIKKHKKAPSDGCLMYHAY